MKLETKFDVYKKKVIKEVAYLKTTAFIIHSAVEPRAWLRLMNDIELVIKKIEELPEEK